MFSKLYQQISKAYKITIIINRVYNRKHKKNFNMFSKKEEVESIGNPAGIGKGPGFGLRERDRDGIGLGHSRLRASRMY